MKKTAINLFILFALIFLNPLGAAAQETDTAQQQENLTTVTLGDLGYGDDIMDGPYDVTRKVFNVPSNWRLLPGGIIELNYDVVFGGVDAGLLETAGIAYVGSLTVSFNSRIIGQIHLEKTGSYTQRFQIPPNAVQSIRESGQHELDIQLIADTDCLYNIRTLITIKAASQFELPFEIAAPELNLTRLPAPFYLRNSLLPDRTVLVIPDAPTALELQAALNVQAGFGSMVERLFDFQMAVSNQVAEDMLASSNLIFVGTPDDFPLLQKVPFPTPISNGQFSGLPASSAEDGIVELAHSPWNADKVVLLIGGNTDEAVLKAAKAVSSGKILVYQNPALVYVSDVQELNGGLPLVENFKLQDLGYENVVLQGIGVEEEEYTFYISKEQIATEEGQLFLAYYHSGLLDYSLSSLSIYLNDTVLASKPFTKETEQYTTLPIKIPPGSLRYGENRLVVRAAIEPDFSCDFSGFSVPWVTVSNQTALHLPSAASTDELRPNLLDLKSYPAMFMTHSDLGDLAFILSENDPTGWQMAGSLAYGLGEAATPLIPDIAVSYANDVPGEVRSRSLIFVGKASDMPLLTEFNHLLPAPFDFETDTADERQLQIIYRLPPGINVGYLELIASPYNPEAIILVVSGNSSEGVAMAGGALIWDQLKDRLAGQFAMTNGVQVAVSSGVSHFSIAGTLVPPSNQVVATPLPTIQAGPELPRPVWFLPVLIGSSVIALVVILYVVFRSTSRNRLPKLETPEDASTDTTVK